MQVKSCLRMIRTSICNSTVGVAAGFLAAAISVPLTAGRYSTEDEKPNKLAITDRVHIINNDDRDVIEKLRQEGIKDRRAQETKWAETVYPTIRARAINLYKVEKEDNEKLKAGLITDEERRVKICYVEFVPPELIGHDLGVGPLLEVIKYYDEVQEDGSKLRTYVNEHWTVDEKTGKVSPTEEIRIRTQVFKGSLSEPGADSLFIPDAFLLISSQQAKGQNKDNWIPPLYRQHVYGKFDEAEQKNRRYQVHGIVSSPTKCMHCHSTEGELKHAIRFLIPGEERKNYGAITPDELFEKPYNQQPGYLEYMAYLLRSVRAGELDQNEVKRLLKDLEDSTRMENKLIVEAFTNNDTLPWVEGDREFDKLLEEDPQAEGFKYKDGKVWVRAGYYYFRDLISPK